MLAVFRSGLCSGVACASMKLSSSPHGEVHFSSRNMLSVLILVVEKVNSEVFSFLGVLVCLINQRNSLSEI